jgi:hypothetical protein
MQLVPAPPTSMPAHRHASPATNALTQPETNVRLGTEYFKDLVDRFGGVHYRPASYNAGEGRVDPWMREKRDLDPDEFIDDIPFPETQNYVKRILGNRRGLPASLRAAVCSIPTPRCASSARRRRTPKSTRAPPRIVAQEDRGRPAKEQDVDEEGTTVERRLALAAARALMRRAALQVEGPA